MDHLVDYASLLARGGWTTLEITVLASLLAVAVASATGVLRTSGRACARIPALILVEAFRGTSCYVQLFWAFFALPMVGVSLSPFTTSVLVLGTLMGSYGSEVVRGALQGVPRGQVEACTALNLTRWQGFRWVVLPQAVVAMLPPAGNLLIDLLKLTPLTSLITVSDLTYDAMTIRQQTGSTVASLGIVMAFYFALASLIAHVVGRAEARARTGRGGVVRWA